HHRARHPRAGRRRIRVSHDPDSRRPRRERRSKSSVTLRYNALAVSVDPSTEHIALARELEELNHIGVALSEERDLDRLLDLILTQALEITASDAGSLYLAEADGERLRFVIAQNASLDVPFESTTLAITDRSIAGHVALHGDAIRVADAYALPAQLPYTFN